MIWLWLGLILPVLSNLDLRRSRSRQLNRSSTSPQTWPTGSSLGLSPALGIPFCPGLELFSFSWSLLYFTRTTSCTLTHTNIPEPLFNADFSFQLSLNSVVLYNSSIDFIIPKSHKITREYRAKVRKQYQEQDSPMLQRRFRIRVPSGRKRWFPPAQRALLHRWQHQLQFRLPTQSSPRYRRKR
ncbi:hypothetical protein C8F01DRAFT_1126285 [Mycena amicta]|nr:hypothetical protein C8F01DRAFT_1126285 [Mycena amicta]